VVPRSLPALIEDMNERLHYLLMERHLPYLGSIIYWSMHQLLMARILLLDCTVPVRLQFKHL
jgi:hypothetical protein